MKHHPATSVALVIAALMAILALRTLPVARAIDATTTAAGAASSTSLQAQIDANDQQIATLNQEIATDQAALKQAGADKKIFRRRSMRSTCSAARWKRRWRSRSGKSQRRSYRSNN